MGSKGELVPTDPIAQEIMPTTDALHYGNRGMKIRNFNPTDITIRYRNGNKDHTNVTKCKIQTAKIHCFGVLLYKRFRIIDRLHGEIMS